MNRAKKLKLNIITSLLYQIISLLCGFVLPQFFLRYYGSAVNGLVSSITQFLAVITLCECGVGAVVQSALYRPIAEKNDAEISKIYKSSKQFHNRIAVILIFYMVGLIVFFPIIIENEFDIIYTGVLIVAITISLLARHYLAMTYRLILSAAQLTYIQMTTSIICVVANTVLSIILMMTGASIHSVKIMSSILFLIQPLIYRRAVRKRFNINSKIELNEEPIKQKWNGFAQHLATVVLENTDVMILTVFSTLSNVSIYSVYHLVTSGLRSIFVSIIQNFKSLFGDMYAKNELVLLNKAFEGIEWIMHTSITAVYTMAALLIVPFVEVYTLGITDADYTQPVFGVMMCIAMSIYTLRLPYSHMILAAGHFKQTQTSAIIEMLLNIVISIMCVNKWGIIGVAIGTIIAMTYRTIYFVWYLSKDILKRDYRIFVKQFCIDVMTVVLIFISTRNIHFEDISYVGWLIMAVKVGCISLVDIIVVNLVFSRDKIKNAVWLLKRK